MLIIGTAGKPIFRPKALECVCTRSPSNHLQYLFQFSQYTLWLLWDSKYSWFEKKLCTYGCWLKAYFLCSRSSNGAGCTFIRAVLLVLLLPPSLSIFLACHIRFLEIIPPLLGSCCQWLSWHWRSILMTVPTARFSRWLKVYPGNHNCYPNNTA